ncbi:MAG: MFS transporter [Geodermatophilaceae bacterium]|nr:MFS transporter [Geodermatophilaceae bacterium]MDQ3457482.1 MFS transporter [Actinomycetota bacterium]
MTTGADAQVSPQLRRERRGWYFYDFATSVFSTSVVTVFLAPYLTEIAEAAADERGQVYPLGIGVPPGSFFAYVLSFSTLIQVLFLPILGAIADRTQRKREMLAVFAYLGAFATMGLFFVADERYLLGAGLFMLANLAYGASIVIYYSFLPEIAGPNERDDVSSRGWAFGYLGSGILLALNLVLFLNAEALGVSDGTAVRICLLSAGGWWAIFAAVTVARLRRHQPRQGQERGTAILTGGFRQLAHTFRDMRRYPKTLLFLAAFLLYNDGIQTAANVAGQYGERELGLERSVLISAILLVQFVAIGGALLMGRIAKVYGAKRTILGGLGVWVGVLAMAYFLAEGDALQFYLLGVVLGLVLGGSQALSRSLYSQLIPPGKEAEYFSFYEMSDRGTSWLGPFLFGLTFQLTGSYRDAIVSLVIFFVLGAAILALVPVREAIREAGNAVPEKV